MLHGLHMSNKREELIRLLGVETAW